MPPRPKLGRRPLDQITTQLEADEFARQTQPPPVYARVYLPAYFCSVKHHLTEIDDDKRAQDVHHCFNTMMHYTGAVIDDQEKTRLSTIMQQSSDSILSHPLVPDTLSAPKSRQHSLPANELQRLFDTVTQEIEERRAFLATAAESVEPRNVARISKEIAERLVELKRLDHMLREESGL